MCHYTHCTPVNSLHIRSPVPLAPIACFTRNRAQRSQKFCAPRRWIWRVFHLRKSPAKQGPSDFTLCSLQEEKWNKVANRKISSVKTGSLLLITIPNMWYLREKWVPVAQTLSAPVVVSTCCCPQHWLVNTACGSPADSPMWPSSPLFAFPFKNMPLFSWAATT